MRAPLPLPDDACRALHALADLAFAARRAIDELNLPDLEDRAVRLGAARATGLPGPAPELLRLARAAASRLLAVQTHFPGQAQAEEFEILREAGTALRHLGNRMPQLVSPHLAKARDFARRAGVAGGPAGGAG